MLQRLTQNIVRQQLTTATLTASAPSSIISKTIIPSKHENKSIIGITHTCTNNNTHSIQTRSFSSQCNFPGAPRATWTTEFNIFKDTSVRQCYRVLDENGQIIRSDYKPLLDKEKFVSLYKHMCTLNIMDRVFYDAQRQGRISFYMTGYGEEAAVIGSAAALESHDVAYCQYREAGIFMYRGFTLPQFADQCFSNAGDSGKGRQMPVHYGSAKHNIHTVSSPLTTQLPQAAGAAYALKLAKSPAIVMCYFGEGAASEGDFHAALNFAATLKCPVIFFVRNNGYAISTATSDQYAGDGIVSRASGYGMHSIRVDGNDLLAVHEATSNARQLAHSQQLPVLIEAMTYRAGHHSTSDDSSRYRALTEIQHWQEKDNPLTRARLYMEQQGWWDSEQETKLLASARKEVLVAFSAAEAKKKPPISEIFTDVYHDIPPHLLKQQAELHQHLEKYGKEYPLDEHASS